MRWTLRKAEKKDFHRINELFVEMLQTIYQTDHVKGYSDGDLDRFFESQDEWISIAMDNERIVAFLSIEVHREDKEFIYLDDFSVTKQYRGKGIGSSMIRSVESYAKELQFSTICLHVEKSNTAAFRLYERLGYKIHEDQGSRYLMINSSS